MAAKRTPVKNGSTPRKSVAKTEVRNTSIPPAAPVAKVITQEMIARRAYEISLSSNGSELDNWYAAERELRNGN